jgi:succinate-semialdehyde dehydrogenase / glutarate-semialdehyde dehydrogenase
MTADVLLYVNGSWTHGSGGRTIDLVNPATGEKTGRVAVAETADLDLALADMASAFPVWKVTSPIERGRVLRKAAELLRARADEIVPVMSEQQGKTFFEARYEVNASADSFEWFAEEARRAYGRIVPSRMPMVNQLVYREPIGPALGLVPWNFAMGQAARKVGAALAVGCPIILKGAEETPSACAFLVQALLEAGLPGRTIALVFGIPAEISDYLIPHPVIRKVSFTGSTAVGKRLGALAARHMKRFTAELGGHAPVIVTADVDLMPVVRMLATAKYRNAGQVCVAPTRFLIERELYGPFTQAFAEVSAGWKVGLGSQAGIDMGPLANTRRLDAIDTLVADAVAHGAKLCTGGKRRGNIGNFYEPTVLSDVPISARIMNEEPFGPVALLRPFDKLDDAVQEANRLNYGLAAYAFTRSDKVAEHISNTLEAGMISINGFNIAAPEIPFGGVKDSGYGSEGGSEAIESFLVTKYVSRTAA